MKRTGRVREDFGPEVGRKIGPILAFFSASSCLASATFAAIGSSLYSGNLLSVSSCLCDLAGAVHRHAHAHHAEPTKDERQNTCAENGGQEPAQSVGQTRPATGCLSRTRGHERSVKCLRLDPAEGVIWSEAPIFELIARVEVHVSVRHRLERRSDTLATVCSCRFALLAPSEIIRLALVRK